MPKGLLRIGILALLLGVGGGLAVYWAFGSEDETPPAEIPTIKAEGPSKQRPEQPGGIDIPHQNETVFQQIDKTATGKQPAVEHLLPPPAVPESLSAEKTQTAAPAPSAEIKPQDTLAATASATKGVEKLEAPAAPLPEASKAPAATPGQDTKTEPAVQLTETPKAAETAKETPKETAKEAAKTSAPAAPAKTATTTGNLPKEMFTGTIDPKNFLVQLGSFPDQTTAQKEMSRLQKKYTDTLGSVKLRLAKADLGRKGTYYRVQAGPMTDAQARSICATLWSQKAPCIVVRP